VPHTNCVIYSNNTKWIPVKSYRGADKSLAQPGRKQATATEDFNVHISYYHNWRNISTIYIYITRLASNEIFSPSNKIHQEVGQAKDLSAPLYVGVMSLSLLKINFIDFPKIACHV
jgi:hypothetical protein